MDMDKISTEELEQELSRRKSIKEERPKFISRQEEEKKIDILADYCNEGLISIEKTGYLPKDFKQYVYELTMCTFFGDEVFRWINKYNKG